MNYQILFLMALVIAVVIESIVILVLLIWVFKDIKKITLENVLFSIIPTTLTLPYVWFIFSKLFQNYSLYVIVSELLVFLVEAVLIKYLFKTSAKNAFIISFCANLISYLLGLLIF